MNNTNISSGIPADASVDGLTNDSATNEELRMQRVREMGLLDNLDPEARFDQYTKMAVDLLKVPISTLTILDEKKEHFKSCQGLDAKDGDRAISFCGQALLSKDLFIIPDCQKDERFANNPMVTGFPFIRFYAGMSIYDHKTGRPVAVFCIKDTQPRDFSLTEIDTFLSIVNQVEAEINK